MELPRTFPFFFGSEIGLPEDIRGSCAWENYLLWGHRSRVTLAVNATQQNNQTK
jgi:hypothetical protein